MSNTYPNGRENSETGHTLVDDAIDFVQREVKPSWRGWIHAATFPLALVLGIILVVAASTTMARIGSAIFTVSSLLLFGVSALYHRFEWGPKVRALLRRLDHANIILLIAGTYTPITLLCLPREKAMVLLSIIWTGAALGIGFRVFWLGAPRWLYVVLYLALGWAAIIYIVDLFRASWIAMTLVAVGGFFYSLGAVVYGLKRPNPLPHTFGFHEIFHSLTLAAFLCHWTGVFVVATNPPLA